MKTICHLTSVHRLTDTRILYKECSSLAKRYKVYLIAKHHKQDNINNVIVIPFPDIKNRFIRIIFSPVLMLFSALKINADIYHIHDPELIFTLFFLKLFTNAKTIYDVHEYVSDSLYDRYYLNSHLAKILAKIYNFVEQKVLNKFDYLIAATPGIKAEIANLNSHCEVINNFPISHKSRPGKDWNKKKNEICYVGDITKIRGLDKLVDALELVDTTLNLGGYYESKNFRDELYAKKGWEKVNELGCLDRKQVYEVMSKSMAGIIVFQSVQCAVDGYPNKLFEYMEAGIPVIGSDFPLWRKLIRDNHCGILVDSEKPEKIADAIRWILENPEQAKAMGKKGRRLVEKNYNWRKEEKKLFAIYHNLITKENVDD